MPSANDYFKMAEECYRLANEAKTDTDRLACIDLARTWLEAAAQQDEADKRVRHANRSVTGANQAAASSRSSRLMAVSLVVPKGRYQNAKPI
jgi:hypothetical protein